MISDFRQIIAKLKVARKLISDVGESYSGSSIEYVRCFNLKQEIDNLIKSLSK